MFGDADAASTPGAELAEMTDAEKAVSFHHKTLGQRAAIVAAGPIANFLFALIVFAGLFVIVGQPFTPPEIGGVLPDSAAERAGLKAGDRIVAINDQPIERFEEIQRIIQLNLDSPLTLVVRREGKDLRLNAQPTIVEEQDRLGNKMRLARLGIRGGGVEFVRYGPGTALWRALGETYHQTTGTLKAVGQIITGQRNSEELGGPISHCADVRVKWRRAASHRCSSSWPFSRSISA